MNIDAANKVSVQNPRTVRRPVEVRRTVYEPALRALTEADIVKLGGGEPKAPRKVRVRFAPSPTGHLHIGGARTALVNYLFAKKNGGDFLLRIEDTDPIRSEPKYTQAILDGMRWLGIPWDEEPIFQSQRTELYQQKANLLIEKGRAYRDPATNAVYFTMPKEGRLVINDRLKGRVEVDTEPDFPILRSDGSPMFLLANVVDDGEQGITHIFRGHEHLTNAAKQIELFRALDYPIPEFYHMPLIHGDPTPDPEDPSKVKIAGKLSKRKSATSVIDYQKMGFSAPVLINHLARLGMGFDTTETLTLDELTQIFDPTRMQRKSSVLGLHECVEKDGKYEVRPGPLLERMFIEILQMPTEDLVKEIELILADPQRVEAYITTVSTEASPGFTARTGVTADEARAALANLSPEQLFALADGGKRRFSTYMDAIEFAAILRAPHVFDEAERALYGGQKQKALAKKLIAELDRVPAEKWTVEGLSATLEQFNEKNQVKFGQYSSSVRWMMSGNDDGFPLHHSMVVLGREETLARLRKMTK